MKAIFRIRWITEELFNGKFVLVGHWCDPMNAEAIRIKTELGLYA